MSLPGAGGESSRAARPRLGRTPAALRHVHAAGARGDTARDRSAATRPVVESVSATVCAPTGMAPGSRPRSLVSEMVVADP